MTVWELSWVVWLFIYFYQASQVHNYVVSSYEGQILLCYEAS